MSKSQPSVELCKVPDTVKFAYQQEQEMHSSITLLNLRSSVVSFKIKTNKPGIYLVKPMEGQILNDSSVTVTFKRKQLALENFNALVANPNQAKQKFLIELSCEVEDSVGIMQKLQQVAYLGVTFVRSEDSPKKVTPPKLEEPVAQQEKSKVKKVDLSGAVSQKRQQLERLIVERQTLQAKAGGKGTTTFSMMDLVNVLVLAFLAGLVIV